MIIVPIEVPPDSEMVPLSHATCTSILRVAHDLYRTDPQIAYICVHGALAESKKIDPLAVLSDVAYFNLSLKLWLGRNVGLREDFDLAFIHLVFCKEYYINRFLPISPFEDNQVSCETKLHDERSRREYVCETALALFKVLVLLEEFLWEKLLPEEQHWIWEAYSNVKRHAEIFRPFNIFPLDPYSESHPTRRLPEISCVVDLVHDTLAQLQSLFGFQKDNVSNQVEHLSSLLANVQRRVFPDEEPPDDPQEPYIKAEALDTVMNKLLENYIRWYKFLDLKHTRWSPHIEEEKDQQRKLQYIGLYLLVWGEAANLRFMPECLCYIYHHMAFEMFEMWGNKVNEETGELKKPAYGGENEAFLKKVVTPIYQTIATEAKRGARGKHAEGRNYDDLNEYFWSTECFQLGWPMQTTHSFFAQDIGRDGLEVKKVNFVERRSFLQIFRSFERMWIFYILGLQTLIVVAWNEAGGLGTIFQFDNIWSIFSTAVGLEFAQALLNIYLSWNALHSMSFNVKLTYFPKAAVKAICAILVLLPYFYNHFSTLPAILCYGVSKFMMWWYKPRLYVGRGMHESAWSFFKYTMFWIVLLFAKFTFNYYAEIRPLVGLTKDMMQIEVSVYRLPVLFPPAMKHLGIVIPLWSPVIFVYFMDTQIWYAILSTLVGGFIGFFIRLGEVQTLGMLRTRFQFLPGVFNDWLAPINKPDAPPTDDVKKTQFCQMWNSIISSFREEDLISDREMELLLVPYWKKMDATALDYIRWPIYLVASKIPLAVNLAKDSNGEDTILTERLNADIYMKSAVQECYASFKFLLRTIVLRENDLLVINNIFDRIDEHIDGGRLIRSVNWSSLPDLYDKFVQLTDHLFKGTDDLLIISDILLKMLEVVVSGMMREDFERLPLPVDIPSNRFSFLKVGAFPIIDWEKNIKRLYLLLTLTESDMDVPSNLEAQRRLMFFSNSMFMEMPKAPKIHNILSFSALTPYYAEDVLFSNSGLKEKNEDGISILFYLQKIYPDEWKNFLQRVKCDSAEELETTNDLKEERRLWASYRGQTLTRTVRGMMYYRKALELQAFFDLANKEELMKGYKALESSDDLHRECRARADIKFTYVVSCQQYSIHKRSGDSRAQDILRLMTTYPSLRVAYIDEYNQQHEDGTVEKIYYSALAQADKKHIGKDKVLYQIKLPGPPIIGEGKPENQNHAIIFTRGEALQTIDMNQDNYMEEAFKMRNLLQEFFEKHGGVRTPTILGFREHIFTGSVSSLAWFMSNQENSFVTLGQRVLASPLRVRFHYGHPDVFDRLFHITRGGVSKASKTINLSEDIFGGFNSTLREGNITHHEYIQVGKGRDVGLNQISMFEAKIANGSGEQTLSRDLYRLGHIFDFFRMLSCYFTTVGFYFCSMLTVLTVYVFLYGRLYLVLSGLQEDMWKHVLNQKTAIPDMEPLQAAIASQSVVQIGFLMALPMIMVIGVEKGFHKALFDIVLMQFHLAPVFFTFHLGTKAHYFGRTLLHGGAEYRATGRGFVVFHTKFAENYRFYSRSHFVKAFELAILLLVYHLFGATSLLITFSMWFMAFSWFFAPFLFNPSGFEWHKIVEDWKEWTKWIYEHKSWESWWEKEHQHLRHTGTFGSMFEVILASRFFLIHYGLVYQLTYFKDNHSIWVFLTSLLVILSLMLLLVVLGKTSRVGGLHSLWASRTVKLVVFLVVFMSFLIMMSFSIVTLNDIFLSVLAVISTGWGLLLIAQACKPLCQRLGLWSFMRTLAWAYDMLMGFLLFAPVALMAWFSFISEIQTRILFNQDFSRGLQVSHIFGGQAQ